MKEPLNYLLWNRSGVGKNILHLLDEREAMLWKLALPYQDKRGDTGHAEVVTYFALQLLEHVSADRAVVVPAAILHDIGWSSVAREKLALFKPGIPSVWAQWQAIDAEMRIFHQNESVRIGSELLTQAGYIDQKHILDIVRQHDTRKGFLSVEDGVMRDADKLWRYTGIHVESYKLDAAVWYGISLKNIAKPDFLSSAVSRQTARAELENAVIWLNRTHPSDGRSN
ncbi:MAG TPA: HD domain-containing protein [Candidatus Nanoarchaeia archaeon]|nr:HD domain-containing protein [Candidatus Nanoarchaeia archaeon]